MKHPKAVFAAKLIAFFLIVSVCAASVNALLVPKYYYNETWGTTSTDLDFYQLKKNTVDVLFLGSSHAIAAFNPLVLYDEYGITSYNLGSEQQSLLVSYYWLREALKYQSPKAVVLDTFTFYKYYDSFVYNKLNCSEACLRKAMDGMRPSLLKVQAAREIHELDPTQSALSFFLTNIRYHSRWTELSENDYTEASMISHGGLRGFTVLGETKPEETYTPFKDADSDSAEPSEMVGVATEYLERIVNLCESRGIQLILTNIPWKEPVAKYKATKDWAESNSLPYYDFNEEKLYNEIGYDVAEDGFAHPNYIGAEKISSYMGRLLSAEYGVTPRVDDSFDKTRELYSHKLENIRLTETGDICDYLDQLDRDRYSLFLYVPVSSGDEISDRMIQKLRALGFTEDLRDLRDGSHYCAVKDGGQVTEHVYYHDFRFSGSVRDGKTPYVFEVDTTNMKESRHRYDLTVAGADCGNNADGLDIVVYDKEEKSIIDTVNFDTTVPELTADRY